MDNRETLERLKMLNSLLEDFLDRMDMDAVDEEDVEGNIIVDGHLKFCFHQCAVEAVWSFEVNPVDALRVVADTRAILAVEDKSVFLVVKDFYAQHFLSF